MLKDELNYLRTRPRKTRKTKSSKRENLSLPLATYFGKERVGNKIGTEITVILKSRACYWARSASGGCTMCGYFNDRAPSTLTEKDLWEQFEYVLNKYNESLRDENETIVFKIYTSGSFCDERELSLDLQKRILETLLNYKSIKEIVIESRPEFITSKILKEYNDLFRLCGESHPRLYFGIGLESFDDFLRLNIINKGFTLSTFKHALERIHSYGFFVKTYLLFKMPFLSEQSSLIDLYNSIRNLIKLGVDIISINPTNIQQHTLLEELYKMKRFRPPWFYSLFLVFRLLSLEFRENLRGPDFPRLLCVPVAAGKERGIHNCENRNHNTQNREGNYKELLEKFVLTQDFNIFLNWDAREEECWHSYLEYLFLSPY